jgi:hypothetical protein
MSEDLRSILNMLSQGTLNAEQAERLIAALDRAPKAALPGGERQGQVPARRAAKYLRVTVDTEEGYKGPTKVNIRVPMQLLRAGVRLSSLIPAEAREKVNTAMQRKGYAGFDLKDLKPENLEELIAQLEDLTLDVDQEKTKVRIYCE